MPSRRRLGALLVMLTLVGVPAVALRAACAGKTCVNAPGPVAIPFCPLPEDVKALVVNGFREGRSPDVLGVASETVAGEDHVAWPSTGAKVDPSVPIAFIGSPFVEGGNVPDGIGLDQIAPTVSEALAFRRPHPEVRSGAAVPGVVHGGPVSVRAPLIVEIVWDGVGTWELQAAQGAWPFLKSAVDGSTGSGTIHGTTGSVPLDPVATITTIGTGGLPSEHGITGAVIRNDSGAVVRAWGPGSPPSVIATLPDDLDHALGGRPMIGLIAPDPQDRGLVGGGWYTGSEPDDLIYRSGDPARAVAELLHAGYGSDRVPDVIGVVLDGPIVRAFDRQTRSVVDAVRRRIPSAGFVIAATGSMLDRSPDTTAESVAQHADAAVSSSRQVVQETVAGGLFLDQSVLADLEVSSNAVVQAMLDQESAGRKVFADAFPAFAVSFSRYC